MIKEELIREIKVFSEENHGSSNFDVEEIFVIGESNTEFAPLKYLIKKIDGLDSINDLLRSGYVFDCFELFGNDEFARWYERQFSRKLTRSHSKKISFVREPNNRIIFDSIERVHECYETLREEQILMNGKNLPIQLGEWYAKSIFGLKQQKSTSQRGFDFYYGDKRVEVKINWSDAVSPKGVKVKKSLVELSDYCIVIYIARNFMIREICFLDSDFITRKFAGKGHTIFLKDTDIGQYFFSKSSRHVQKVVNSSSLMKYSSPTFAMNLSEYFQ